MASIDDTLWLTDFIDTPLYRLELLGIEETPSVPFTGTYANKLLITHDLKDGIDGREELLLLGKIMQAVKINLAETALVNIHELGATSLKGLIDSLNPQRLICFGQTPDTEIELAQKYTIFEACDTQALLADPLPVISQEVMKKKLLWEALQLMFR